MHSRAHALLTLVVALLAGCRSAPEERTMEELFAGSMRDLTSEGGMGGLDEDVQERQARRIDAARAAWLESRLETPQDHLWCAAVLGSSDDAADLVLAHEIALRADELGDARGRTLSAEILDRQLLKAGKPQRYGTQIVFDPLRQRYRLWDVDPATTDADRRAVGLPSLVELLERADAAERDLGPRSRGESVLDPEYVPDDN